MIPAILITENGAAFKDRVEASRRIADVRRLQYLRAHIDVIGRCIQQSDSVPIRRYFAWPLLDNVEWAEGYSKRFGLVYIDYDTLTRIIKDGGLWYTSLHNVQQYDWTTI